MNKKKFNLETQTAIQNSLKTTLDSMREKSASLTTSDEVQALCQAMITGVEQLQTLKSEPTVYVPDVILIALKENKFECEDNYSQEGNDYIDFKKYIKEGFGETGDDRLEIITMHDSGTFYASVGHRDQNGDYWYENSSQTSNNLNNSIQWLINNAATAPKQKTP